MTFTTRFAPSPTGPLHLGHAYSAIVAWEMAKAAGGQCLLRIEDTDVDRARPHWEDQIYDDLAWLGLTWPQPVLRQSDHLDRYNAVLMGLAERGLVYPCSCSRSDIRAALSAPQEGVTAPQPYPGTCRGRSMASRRAGDALRLDLTAALGQLDGPLTYVETGSGTAETITLSATDLQSYTGDAVLGRKEIETVSYVLASVLDDAAQKVTHVVRGVDLTEITGLQILLQRLLGLPTPIYHHHKLVRDDQGKRLAKRDDARAIAKYRQDGASPEDVRRLIGL